MKKLFILSFVILLTSCSSVVVRQKEIMDQFKRDQAYLRYKGKRTSIQDLKERQVLQAKIIRKEARKSDRLMARK